MHFSRYVQKPGTAVVLKNDNPKQMEGIWVSLLNMRVSGTCGLLDLPPEHFVGQGVDIFCGFGEAAPQIIEANTSTDISTPLKNQKYR